MFLGSKRVRCGWVVAFCDGRKLVTVVLSTAGLSTVLHCHTLQCAEKPRRRQFKAFLVNSKIYQSCCPYIPRGIRYLNRVCRRKSDASLYLGHVSVRILVLDSQASY